MLSAYFERNAALCPFYSCNEPLANRASIRLASTIAWGGASVNWKIGSSELAAMPKGMSGSGAYDVDTPLPTQKRAYAYGAVRRHVPHQLAVTLDYDFRLQTERSLAEAFAKVGIDRPLQQQNAASQRLELKLWLYVSRATRSFLHSSHDVVPGHRYNETHSDPDPRHQLIFNFGSDLEKAVPERAVKVIENSDAITVLSAADYDQLLSTDTDQPNEFMEKEMFEYWGKRKK